MAFNRHEDDNLRFLFEAVSRLSPPSSEILVEFLRKQEEAEPISSESWSQIIASRGSYSSNHFEEELFEKMKKLEKENLLSQKAGKELKEKEKEIEALKSKLQEREIAQRASEDLRQLQATESQVCSLANLWKNKIRKQEKEIRGLVNSRKRVFSNLIRKTSEISILKRKNRELAQRLEGEAAHEEKGHWENKENFNGLSERDSGSSMALKNPKSPANLVYGLLMAHLDEEEFFYECIGDLLFSHFTHRV